MLLTHLSPAFDFFVEKRIQTQKVFPLSLDTESLSIVRCSLWRYYYLQSNSRRDKNYITQYQNPT